MRDFSLIVHKKEVNLMASPSHPETPCTFRFEFDRVNKILLARVEGRLTDESLIEVYGAVRKCSTATDARAGIFDMSSVTEFAISAECVRDLARREPAMPDATRRPRVIAVTSPSGFGFARMFQIAGEKTRPLLEVVHTLDEALAALGIQSPQFTPLEITIPKRASTHSYDCREVYPLSLQSSGLLISSTIDFAASRIVCKR
jgi:hypothetical protein